MKTTQKMWEAARLKLARLEAKMPKCKSVLFIGPGHQSRAYCGALGKHVQHSDGEYHWTTQKFSGFFDESPEYEGEPQHERRASLSKPKGRRKG